METFWVKTIQQSGKEKENVIIIHSNTTLRFSIERIESGAVWKFAINHVHVHISCLDDVGCKHVTSGDVRFKIDHL